MDTKRLTEIALTATDKDIEAFMCFDGLDDPDARPEVYQQARINARYAYAHAVLAAEERWARAQKAAIGQELKKDWDIIARRCGTTHKL